MLAQTGPMMINCLTMQLLSSFTDNSPSEESSATVEKEEETEEYDHEGEPFAFKTGINHCI